jgi:hypothetical protein
VLSVDALDAIEISEKEGLAGVNEVVFRAGDFELNRLAPR